MTSTSFNVGLGDGKKVSSRILRPPGGGHTDIFGGEPEPPRRGRGRPQAPFALFNEEKPTNGTAQNGTHAPVNGDAHQEPAPQESAPQESAPQEIAPQEITPQEPAPQEPVTQEAQPQEIPEAIESPKKVEDLKPVEVVAPKFEPPKRVRVPPGGFSSGLW